MGSTGTGSGFLGLARGMAEYLTYLPVPMQDRKTIVEIIGNVLLPRYQTIEHSPFHFSEKFSISF